jgi:hypothetical protein
MNFSRPVRWCRWISKYRHWMWFFSSGCKDLGDAWQQIVSALRTLKGGNRQTHLSSVDGEMPRFRWNALYMTPLHSFQHLSLLCSWVWTRWWWQLCFNP